MPTADSKTGAAKMAGDRLSRFAKCSFVSGHGEGWALYAERLADEDDRQAQILRRRLALP